MDFQFVQFVFTQRREAGILKGGGVRVDGDVFSQWPAGFQNAYATSQCPVFLEGDEGGAELLQLLRQVRQIDRQGPSMVEAVADGLPRQI